MATQAELEILLDKSMNPSTPLGQKVFKRSMIEILGDDYDFDNTPIRQIELDLFNMAAVSREEMENAIRKIEEQFGQDSSDLEELDLIDIKEIYNEYMDKYAESSQPPTISMAKSGGEVLSRPMFRRNGSPSTGERVSNLQTLLQDIRDTERLRSTVGNAESDNVQRQLGNLLRVPFEEFQGKYVRNPMSGEIEPMSGPLTGTVLREGEMMLDPNSVIREGEVEMVTVIDRREGSKTFGMPISVPRNMDTYEMIRSGMFEFDEIAGMAEGGEMKSDAVGIADGLDQETPKADPNTTGVAKVSPEQYVELMNQVRGDDVPLEGRVQELAMTVGEKDAQDTPLSVLALVQPVFELQEQQGGLAAAPGAQQMMQQQNPMMMAKDGGIVQRFNGSDSLGERSQNVFSALGESGVYDPAKLQIAEALAKVYGVTAEPFDTQAARQKYEQMLINKEGLRDEALLAAAPEFLRIGALALDPNATLTDVFREGATGLARFGTTQGKKLKNLEQTALKMALADKATEDKSKQAFMSAITGPLLEDAFKTTKESELEDLTLEELTVKIAGDKTKNLLDELEVTFKNVELGYADENQMLDLQTKRTELDKNLILLNSLEDRENAEIQKIITDTNLAIAQIDGAELSNEAQSISNQFLADKENATLQGQILNNTGQQLSNLSAQFDLDAKPDMLKETLDKIKLENEKLFKEVSLADDFAAQKYKENELKIQELESKINGNLVDPETIRVRDAFTKNFKNEIALKDAAKLTFHYDSLSKAILREDLTAEKVAELTGGGPVTPALKELVRKNPSGASDLVIMFNFMKMLDPDSVVREGEQLILTKQANPLARKFDAYIKQITGDGFLSSEGRAEILTETQKIMDNAYKKVLETKDAYTEIGKVNFPDLVAKGQLDTFLPVTGFQTYLDDLNNKVYGEEIPSWMKEYVQ